MAHSRQSQSTHAVNQHVNRLLKCKLLLFKKKRKKQEKRRPTQAAFSGFLQQLQCRIVSLLNWRWEATGNSLHDPCSFFFMQLTHPELAGRAGISPARRRLTLSGAHLHLQRQEACTAASLLTTLQFTSNQNATPPTSHRLPPPTPHPAWLSQGTNPLRSRSDAPDPVGVLMLHLPIDMPSLCAAPHSDLH